MSTRTPRGVVWRKGKGAYIFGIVGRFALATLVLVSATFAMIHLIPGDPVRAALGRTASPELVAERREALGLNHSLARQYVDYLWNVAHGNLGTSFVTGQPVSEILSTRLPNTFALAVPAFV